MLNASPAAPLDLETCPLPDFGAAVNLAARTVGTASHERFGGRKVFVSAVYRALTRTCDVGTLDGFKARLVQANRYGHIELARADLVSVMPTATVEASEIRSLGATFHFVIDRSAREAWEVAS